MFDGYTTAQLVGLRSLCVDLIEDATDMRKAADALVLLELLDKELAEHELKPAA